jgi:hypothetical protein
MRRPEPYMSSSIARRSRRPCGEAVSGADDLRGLFGADHPGQSAAELGTAGELGEVVAPETAADEVGGEGTDRRGRRGQRSGRVALAVERARPGIDVGERDLGPVRPAGPAAVGREADEIRLVGLGGAASPRRVRARGAPGRRPPALRRSAAPSHGGLGRLRHASSVLPRPSGSLHKD